MRQLIKNPTNQNARENYESERLPQGGNLPARLFSPQESGRATSGMQSLRLLLPEPPVLIVKGLRETSDRIPALTSVGSARTTHCLCDDAAAPHFL